jgi:hypothetical protein
MLCAVKPGNDGQVEQRFYPAFFACSLDSGSPSELSWLRRSANCRRLYARPYHPSAAAGTCLVVGYGATAFRNGRDFRKGVRISRTGHTRGARILGVLSLAKKYGAATVDCSSALRARRQSRASPSQEPYAALPKASVDVGFDSVELLNRPANETAVKLSLVGKAKITRRSRTYNSSPRIGAVSTGIKRPHFHRFCCCERAIGGEAVRTL